MTNVTPQQLEEFDTTFHAFDKDNSNKLNLHEFKACLQSLGKAYDDAEAQELFAKVSNHSEIINFEQFTGFMVSITEDRVTLDQLRQSFKAMAGGRRVVQEVELRQGMVPAEQVDYLVSVMPQVDGGYDYEAYLSTAFQ